MKSDECRLEPMVLLSRGLLHDINNHLAPVIAYPDMLREEIQDPDTLDMLTEIERGAKETSELVRRLQIILRCGADLEEEEFDLRDLLESVANSTLLSTLLIDYPQVQLVQRPSLQPLPVKASRSHLQQALFLLVRQRVGNFSQGGDLELSCGISDLRSANWDSTLTPGQYATLELRANGPQSERPEMEQKKVQLEYSFAQGIIRDLGGSIRETLFNGGTSTTIFLPIHAHVEPVPPVESVQDSADPRKTILVVDDLRSQRRITSLLLEDLGYHAVSVNCGEDALEYLSQHHNEVDLMLLDMNMGGRMDGYDTYEHSLAINPNLRCVLVSAFSNSERANMTLDLGAEGPLEKPFRVEELDRVVRDALV